MKSSKKATSIVEAMVVMLIVVSWVVWMYTVFNESQQLSNTSANKIQAIQIAREWIEAMKNIRDTNWILYWSDTKNCWNTLNYQSNCVWASTPFTATDIEHDTSYKIYQDTDNRWKLKDETPPADGFKNSWYRTNFKVWLDINWFYTQSWGLIDSTNPLKPLFTREIKIKYIDTNWWTANSNDEKMQVTSLVQWVDSASTQAHKVEFTTILTNWKK